MQNRGLLQLTKIHVFMGTYMRYVMQINGKLRAIFGKTDLLFGKRNKKYSYLIFYKDK